MGGDVWDAKGRKTRFGLGDREVDYSRYSCYSIKYTPTLSISDEEHTICLKEHSHMFGIQYSMVLECLQVPVGRTAALYHSI